MFQENMLQNNMFENRMFQNNMLRDSVLPHRMLQEYMFQNIASRRGYKMSMGQPKRLAYSRECHMTLDDVTLLTIVTHIPT